MDPSTTHLKQRSNQPLDTLIDSRRFTPNDLQGKYDDPSTNLPPIYSLSPGEGQKINISNVSSLTSEISEDLLSKKQEYDYESFDLPDEKTFDRFTLRWDLWLYFVLYIVVIMITLLFFTNIYNSKFFQELNYPNWAPAGWVLALIWGVVFITSLFSLWVLSSHQHASFYVLLLLMNIVFIMLFIIAVWFTGVVILGSIVLGIAVLFSIFVCVTMARDSMLAMGLQIPYILFIILLFVITLQMSHDNS